MLLAEKQLSRQPIRAFHFIGRRTDRGLTAIYHEGHLKHVVLPAIDRVLRRTGFNAESYTRNDVLMAVLGLDPDTKHVFTAPDALYSGPGVANVLNISSAATGKYKDLPWPEMNLAQNLISAVYECSDYVAYNAQELKFTIALDEESTRDCAVLFLWSMGTLTSGRLPVTRGQEMELMERPSLWRFSFSQIAESPSDSGLLSSFCRTGSLNSTLMAAPSAGIPSPQNLCVRVAFAHTRKKECTSVDGARVRTTAVKHTRPRIGSVIGPIALAEEATRGLRIESPCA